MEVIVIESKAFDELKKEFEIIVKSALKEMLDSLSGAGVSDWISHNEAQKLLNFRSKSSWQKLRDTGTIVFSQSGRKIMYSRKSILAFLEKNKVEF